MTTRAFGRRDNKHTQAVSLVCDLYRKQEIYHSILFLDMTDAQYESSGVEGKNEQHYWERTATMAPSVRGDVFDLHLHDSSGRVIPSVLHP